MRKDGRPIVAIRRFRRPAVATVERKRVEVRGGFTFVVQRGSLYVLLTQRVTFTGSLVRQSTFPCPLWESMSDGARERTIMDFFRRPGLPSPVGGVDGSSSMDGGLLQDYPALAHYLGADHWPDGELRQRSTLVVFWEEGAYKCCLSEKDTGMSLWATAKAFDGIPEALEGRLTADVVDWRKQRPMKKKS